MQAVGALSLLWASQVAQLVENPSAMQEAQETRIQSLSWKDPLEKGMATHLNILAWRIPWTEEPGNCKTNTFQGVKHLIL